MDKISSWIGFDYPIKQYELPSQQNIRFKYYIIKASKSEEIYPEERMQRDVSQ